MKKITAPTATSTPEARLVDRFETTPGVLAKAYDWALQNTPAVVDQRGDANAVATAIKAAQRISHNGAIVQPWAGKR